MKKADYRRRENRFDAQARTRLPDGRKLFRITRQSRPFVWLRWVAYGTQMKGLSLRVTVSDFRRDWLSVSKSDGLEEQVFFRRAISQNASNQTPPPRA